MKNQANWGHEERRWSHGWRKKGASCSQARHTDSGAAPRWRTRNPVARRETASGRILRVEEEEGSGQADDPTEDKTAGSKLGARELIEELGERQQAIRPARWFPALLLLREHALFQR